MKKEWRENFNWPMAGILSLLLCVGLANLYSALGVWGEEGLRHLFWLQVLWVSLGICLLLLMVMMDYRFWDRLGKFFYLFSIILLAAVLLFGRDISGHRSWIGIGSFTIQPSELAKLGLVFLLAKFFSDNPSPWGFSLRGLIKPIFFTAVPFGLILLQKDLGSSLFFPLIFITMALIAKVKRSTLLILLLLVSGGGTLAYQYGLKPYQKERLKVFLNPESDPKRSGYHLIQSKIAVGSGRILGKGYLKGKINKLRYLPDKHTDFIFPVLAEEWGFFGSLALLFLFAVLFLQGIQIARKAREGFGLFLAVGIVAIFFWHLVINIGGVLGMIPLTGVPLPFLSYGGSSTLLFMMGMGLLFNIHVRRFMF